MEKGLKYFLPAVLLSILIGGLQSCYYDNEEALYPIAVECDTLIVTYSATIAPIMNAFCNECHGGSTPNAGYNTDTYIGLKYIADNGKLFGVTHHEPGFQQMPKDRPQLSSCNLDKIRIWINEGALDN